jgi:hypothetical protein
VPRQIAGHAFSTSTSRLESAPSRLSARSSGIRCPFDRNATISTFKRFASALHNVANRVANLPFLETPLGLDLRLPASNGQSHNEFGITVHDNIGIMGNYEHLPTLFDRAELFDNQVIDQVIVEVVFGLIQDDRLLAVG